MLELPQRWTLAFRDADIEREFRRDQARASVRAHRVMWCGFVVALSIPAIADLWSAGSRGNLHVLLLARFLVTIPIGIAVAAFGWTSPERFARGRDTAVTFGALAVVAQDVLAAALMPDPANFHIRDGAFSTMMVTFAVSALLSLQFARALGVVLLHGVLMTAFVIARFPEPDPIGLAFWIALASTIGLVGAWQIEQSKRRAFLANRRSEELLYNVLPQQIADRLKTRPALIADHFDEVTVLFGDIAGFTPLSTQLTPHELVTALNDIFSAFDDIAHRHGLEKIKTIGDAYMVVGGVPTPRADHADAIAKMALEMRDVVAKHRFAGDHTLRMRIGIHSGPVVAGVIGKKKFIYDLWGDTVNTASRMESHGVEGAVQVTAATYALLRDRFAFTARGAVQVKGKGALNTWLLDGPKSEPPR